MYQVSFSPLLSNKKEEGLIADYSVHSYTYWILKVCKQHHQPYDLKIGLFDLEISWKMKNGESCTIVCSRLYRAWTTQIIQCGSLSLKAGLGEVTRSRPSNNGRNRCEGRLLRLLYYPCTSVSAVLIRSLNLCVLFIFNCNLLGFLIV